MTIIQKGEPMSDLISRQAAIDALAKFVPYAICDESTESYTNGLTDAYNLICQLPPAQPEIIRCKACKHRDPEDKKCDCGHDIQWQLPRQDDWYCADAKRRTDESNV